MAKRYGLPYQGSKSKLAERIVALLPSARHLYDVFAGGCAISHCALQSGKWDCVHFSDTNDSVVLFRDCLEGNIPDGSEWISREAFLARKDTDPYVRLIWSFGNNQQHYLYSRRIEPYKKAVHEMIFAKTPDERRLKFRQVCNLMPSAIRGGYRPGDIESTEKSRRVCSDFSQRSGKGNYPPPRILSMHQSSEAHRRLSSVSNLWSDGVANLLFAEEKNEESQSPTLPFAAGSMR